MSDLSRFRDHARQMSEAGHTSECEQQTTRAKNRWSHFRLFGEWLEEWGKRPAGPPFACAGTCVTDADRALWGRLADEADAHLSRDQQDSLIP